MTPKEKKKFYLVHIYPKVKEVHRLCRENGISLLSVCGWENGEKVEMPTWGILDETSPVLMMLANGCIAGDLDTVEGSIQQIRESKKRKARYVPGPLDA